MAEQAKAEEARIKALLEGWADAVRRHDLPAILAHHDRDIVMFDLPPPLQCRGIEACEQPGICFSVTTSRVWPSTFENSPLPQALTSPSRSPSCGADLTRPAIL